MVPLGSRPARRSEGRTSPAWARPATHGAPATQGSSCAGGGLLARHATSSEERGTPMAVTCGVAHLPYTGKQRTAGQRIACVSEVRLAPYVHDRHRADHGVRDYRWRCAMTGEDRVIGWFTADATAGARLSCRPPDADPLQVQAARFFADDLAAGRVPLVRAIRGASCRTASRAAGTGVPDLPHRWPACREAAPTPTASGCPGTTGSLPGPRSVSGRDNRSPDGDRAGG